MAIVLFLSGIAEFGAMVEINRSIDRTSDYSIYYEVEDLPESQTVMILGSKVYQIGK